MQTYTLILSQIGTESCLTLADFINSLNVNTPCLQVSTQDHWVIIVQSRTINLNQAGVYTFSFENLEQRELDLIGSIQKTMPRVSVKDELNLLLLSISLRVEAKKKLLLQSIIVIIIYG